MGCMDLFPWFASVQACFYFPQRSAMAMPPYYSSLGPFREVFRTGQPILTYHHVGRCAWGARLKGLYVSSKLFARQMTELQQAGFSTAAFASVAAPVETSKPKVFLTFDDGFRDGFENALPVMQQHRFCGIQFLVSDLIGRGLRARLGQQIGRGCQTKQRE